MQKIKQKLADESKRNSGWLESANFRQANAAWLDISFAIGLAILKALREKNMTQKDLAGAMQCSPQYVNKIVKGSENLTLETICKIENVLNISLISTHFPIYSSTPNPSSQPVQQ